MDFDIDIVLVGLVVWFLILAIASIKFRHILSGSDNNKNK
jgi:hypothetical protein